MRDSSYCRHVDLEGESGQSLNSCRELLDDVGIGDIDDRRFEDTSIFEDLDRDEAIEEGSNIQFLEKRGFRRADLLSLLDKMDLIDNLDCPFVDSSGDVQRLHEVGLTGIERCASGREEDIRRGDGSDSSGSGQLVVTDIVSDGLKVSGGKDKSYVSLDMRKKDLEVRVLRQLTFDRLSHHCIFPHEYLGLSSKVSADALHVVGTNIVSTHNQNLIVFVE